jgi:hypothetical protein
MDTACVSSVTSGEGHVVFSCFLICWNRVFECKYQQYITEYFDECNLAKFPTSYFPALNNAQDACSCNLGNVVIGIFYQRQSTARLSAQSARTEWGRKCAGTCGLRLLRVKWSYFQVSAKKLPNNDSSLNPKFPLQYP